MIFRTVICCMVICICLSSVDAIDYKEEYFDQRLDHFNFVSYGNKTFKQRYLYNATWWNPSKGPIFFYAGNEGDILDFWQNTGFMFEIAPYFKALVIFGEHRYYGKSLPFGNDSFTGSSIGLLSIEQALADYAFLIKSLKTKFKAENSPVIAFGGSYGGMLAAYMRFKFPNVVYGAIAASAPIYQVAGVIGAETFFQAVSKDFVKATPKCESLVRSAFAQLKKWADLGPAGYFKISKTFHLCNEINSPDDYQHFLRWVRNAFVMAAMMDYPYPASFMANFPAYPVTVMCKNLASSSMPADGLYKATSLFYNASTPVTCFDTHAEYLYCADPTGCGLGSDSKAWDYQACTEVNLEGGSNGVTDIFPVLPFNSSMRDEYCLKTWNVLPRRNWLDVMMWGSDINSTSNIVFSNGNLDPWAAGGVLNNISGSVLSVLVDGGAHHLDLRASNPADPISVKFVRSFETNAIFNWLDIYYRFRNKK